MPTASHNVPVVGGGGAQQGQSDAVDPVRTSFDLGQQKQRGALLPSRIRMIHIGRLRITTTMKLHAFSLALRNLRKSTIAVLRSLDANEL
jgi:hypothetical protein